ncbi:MAG: carboxylating nicotinate-nucleotide diphosphorylase [Chloroflexi bacterium]|nr:carboxylating nicotinate-nucleotide diphosphorylase [Chloroflexota bacterium]
MTEAVEASPPDSAAVAAIVASALAEDRAGFDVTTRSTVTRDQRGEATLLYKQDGVVCGLEVVREVFRQVSPEIELRASTSDGAWVEPGTAVATVSGPLAPMLSGERVALNLMQRMSGIATLARQYVEAASAGGWTRVVDTRKTTPGLRTLERYAVRTGGAHNHRDTLQDGVLIKDNHIEAAAQRGVTIPALLASVRAEVPHTLRIEIEVTSPEMARAALAGGADVVLLDNMTPAMMAAIVTEARAKPAYERVLFEASGGITLGTIASVAATGVDLISCGALTHSAPALDISLDVRPA